MTWNQKRPDKLAPGEDPDVRQSNRAALGGAKRSGREYKCGHCGEPKKGHVCAVAGGGDVNKRARISPPPPAAASPALPPMRREQYDDMLKMGIIDPAKVTKSALLNAVSVATLLLTTDALIANKPEAKSAPPEMDGLDDMAGMGGMGGRGGMGDIGF